jgi:hypothetical protein
MVDPFRGVGETHVLLGRCETYSSAAAHNLPCPRPRSVHSPLLRWLIYMPSTARTGNVTRAAERPNSEVHNQEEVGQSSGIAKGGVPCRHRALADVRGGEVQMAGPVGVGDQLVRKVAIFPKSILAVGIALGLMVGFQSSVGAVTTPYYPSGSNGYDVSYPNCSTPIPSSGFTFAIVGVGGGRPFTGNSCAGAEFSAASSPTAGDTALYFNTGYAGAYARDITSTCQTAVGSAKVFVGLKGHTLTQAQQAWEIGCSEANYALVNEPGTPVMWWADVETGNSWSTNATLNRYTIDGISSQMQAEGGGGIYSSPGMWTKITGSTTWEPTPPVLGTWITGGATCTTGFGNVTTWVVQGGSVNGYDQDTGCQS